MVPGMCIVFVDDQPTPGTAGGNAAASGRQACEDLYHLYSGQGEVAVFYDPDPTEPCGWWFEFNQWRRAGFDDTAHMRHGGL